MGVVNNQVEPIWMNNEDRPINIRPVDRTHGWFLPPGRMGYLSLRFIGDESTLNMLAALFLFLEKWGSLGAKPQLGYGVFEIVNREDVKVRAIRYPWQVIGASFPECHWPDMRRFGFVRYNFLPKDSEWWMLVPGVERVAKRIRPAITTYKTVPIAPALKNEWRFHQWHAGRGDEKLMFGTLQWLDADGTKRLKSKVAVSWAYSRDNCWEVRGWGWLPKQTIANMVWDILRDSIAWQNAIQVPGSLESRPTGAWCEWMAKDVVRFLEDAK